MICGHIPSSILIGKMYGSIEELPVLKVKECDSETNFTNSGLNKNQFNNLSKKVYILFLRN